MRDTRRTGQTQFKAKGCSNVTFGYTFVHNKRASYSSQPDVLPGHRTFAHSGSLHAAGCSKSASFFVPSFQTISFPLIYKPDAREISISIPHLVCGFVVCIIFPLTQFVNRLIPLFCRLHFLHDGFPILHCPGCAVLLKVGL